MRRWPAGLVMSAVLAAATVPAWADGPQFAGTCNQISWQANNESDLAGYRLYDRVSLSATPSLIATFGAQVTSVPCSQLGLNPGQHYISLRAYDVSGNESPFSTESPFVLVVSNLVSDLRVQSVGTTEMTLAFTMVDDGTGNPAKYDVRIGSPVIDWGTASPVANGTCAGVVTGSPIGGTKTCTVTSLSTTTAYQFQLVPYRGTLGADAVFGPLSNIVGATTGGTVPLTGRYRMGGDAFTRGDSADLGPAYTTIGSNPGSIVSNHVELPGGGPKALGEVHTAELPSRQYCQVVIQEITGAADIWAGCSLRSSLTTDTGYTFLAARGSGAGSYIELRTAGSNQVLNEEHASTWIAGDVLRGEADGGLLRLYKNDVKVQEVTNDVIPSGHAGLWAYLDSGGSAADLRLDDFEFGGLDSRLTLQSDTFDRSLIGPDWQGGLSSGSTADTDLTIASNGLRATSTAGNNSMLFVPTGSLVRSWSRATVSTITGSGSQSQRLLSRFTGTGQKNGIECAMGRNESFSSRIAKWVNGEFVLLANESGTTWTNGDFAQCDQDEDVVTLYRNDEIVLQARDGTYASGFLGLTMYTTSLTDSVMDNYLAGTFGAVQPTVGEICGCDNH